MNSRLRIGLLLDSYFLPAWAFTAIEQILRSSYAELALVVLNHSRPKRWAPLRVFWQACNHWLYHIFNSVDEKLFLRGPIAAAQVDSSETFSSIPVFEVEPIDERGEQHFSALDVEQLKSYQLDILVKMGFGNLRGDISFAASCGIWTYRWGDPRKIKDGLTSFWEVVRSWPETGAAFLQLGAAAEHDKVLFESWFFTYPYSPARSKNYVLWAASSFLPRQVERLFNLGGEKFLQALAKKPAVETPKSQKTNGIPSNLMVMWIVLKLAARNLLEVSRRSFYREQWELLFHLKHDNESNTSTFKRISPPKDRFWADPHVIYKRPNYFIFVEEYLYQIKRGHISVIEMDQKGNYKLPIPILQNSCHLSFPFVFNWMGHYYMIPESSDKRTIDLYECTEFPNQWQFRITLMQDLKAVDTTLFYTQRKWWLFTAISENKAAAPQVELFLFYSDELFTDQWRAHPMNPIVSDVKRARAAGRLFMKDGKLFRPSQDCSKMYGYGFDLNEIVVLSETDYCERTMTSVRPDRGKRIIATHTYTNQGNLTVIDALTRRFKWVKKNDPT
ncbi:MAG: hypothetical protein WCC12_10820 [Anaerolineales bacterium]